MAGKGLAKVNGRYPLLDVVDVQIHHSDVIMLPGLGKITEVVRWVSDVEPLRTDSTGYGNPRPISIQWPDPDNIHTRVFGLT